MNIIISLIAIIIISVIFYLLNNYLDNKENFCYGNDFCNGNKDSALCIDQSCLPCGLNAPCKKDSDCGPNNCIDGCCDGT
jgi:hypothetical protein